MRHGYYSKKTFFRGGGAPPTNPIPLLSKPPALLRGAFLVAWARVRPRTHDWFDGYIGAWSVNLKGNSSEVRASQLFRADRGPWIPGGTQKAGVPCGACGYNRCNVGVYYFAAFSLKHKRSSDPQTRRFPGRSEPVRASERRFSAYVLAHIEELLAGTFLWRLKSEVCRDAYSAGSTVLLRGVVSNEPCWYWVGSRWDFVGAGKRSGDQRDRRRE